MNFEKGFASLATIVIMVLVIGAGIGGFLVFNGKQILTSQEVLPLESDEMVVGVPKQTQTFNAQPTAKTSTPTPVQIQKSDTSIKIPNLTQTPKPVASSQPTAVPQSQNTVSTAVIWDNSVKWSKR